MPYTPLMTDNCPLYIAELSERSPHLPVVAKWLNDEWGQSLGYDLSDTLAWCNHLIHATNETIIVAKQDDRLVGTVCVVECDLERRKDLCPWLSSLYVPSSERGKRTGQALITAACDWALQRGHSDLYLYASKGRLIAYYSHLNWLHMSDLDIEGAMFGLMRKPLHQVGGPA